MTGRAFDQLEADDVRFEHQRAGVLQVFTSAREIGSHLADLELMAQFGSPSPRYLSGREARALESALSGSVAGGVLCSDDRHLDPASFVDGTANVCIRLGVRFTGGERIGGLDVRDGHAAAGCGRGTVGGPTRSRSPPEHGHPESWPRPVSGCPCKPARDTVATSPPRRSSSAMRSTSLTTRSPSPRSSAASGVCGTMEFTGLDVSVDRVRAAAVAAAAELYFDGWPRRIRPVPWASLRPMTPDGLTLIGLTPGRDNVAIATGHAMLGITLSPVTGHHIARLLLDDTTSPQPFSPARFRALAVGPTFRRPRPRLSGKLRGR